MSGLTAKQEAFVQAYLKVGNQRQAYRAAYSAGKMSDAAVDVEACELLKTPKVALRVKELQERTAKRTEVTVETVQKKLEAAYLLAVAEKQTGAAVAAAMGMAKLHGLIIDQKHVKQETTATVNVQGSISAVDEIVGRFVTDRPEHDVPRSLPN